MKPATAIGASLDGERLESDVPWRATVPFGEVSLGYWPSSATSLRGAVVAAVGPDAHIDLHNHVSDDETRPARATVLYRVRDQRAYVWAMGPRAAGHLAQIARLSALRLPQGEFVPLHDVQMRFGQTEMGTHKSKWMRYELASPYYPARHAASRCSPLNAGWAFTAWAGNSLVSSIRILFRDLGLHPPEHRPIHVQISEISEERVCWRGRTFARGFFARFATNAILPSGIGIGCHAAEGFGEVRPC